MLLVTSAPAGPDPFTLTSLSPLRDTLGYSTSLDTSDDSTSLDNLGDPTSL